MRKILHYKLLLFFICICGTLQAQWKNDLWVGKQANNWYFGDAAGVTFSTSPPQAITNSGMEPDVLDQWLATEGTGSISDEAGNLLFYTNGVSVWNKNNEKMPNGTDLDGNVNSTQSGLIVPMPGNPNMFYIFSIYSGPSFPNPNITVVYSVVDMTLNGGLGDITDEKNILIHTGAQEKISAVYHADKEKIWVIVSSDATNAFKAFLISAEGINTTPTVSNIGIGQEFGAVGQMKFSPNGKLLAKSVFTFGQFYVEVFNFDNETGQVQNIITTFNPTDFPGEIFGCYGIEFSPNSNVLYVASTFTAKVYQFDLLAGTEQDIKSSGIVIGQDTEFSNFSMQLAPDGKIYLARGSFGVTYDPNGTYIGTQTTLNVINYPNNLGEASVFTQAGLDLANGRNDTSLPGFIQSYFESGILYDGNCSNQEVTFTTVRIPGITSISWDFGDPASGASNISSESVHAFSGPGTYTVTAHVTSNGAVQKATTEVVIVEGPKAISPATELLAQCADANGNAVFNLSSFSTKILDGQDTDIFSLAYYATDVDRLANNPVTDLANFTTSGQTIYAIVTNSETGCYTVLPLNLVVNPLPIVTIPTTIQQCGNLVGTSVFNLKDQDAVILNGQNPDGFTITYYSDAAMTTIIGQPESFISAGQTIYAEVTNSTTGCSSSVSFDTVVIEVDLISGELIFEGCSPFNLTLILPQLPTGLTVSFYPTEQDALNGTNAITDTENYKPAANNDKIYIVATNAEGCQSIEELKLKDAGCVIPRGISPNGDGMNDTFDLSAFDVKRLEVFNRYGQEVYSQENYTDQWYGQGRNGDELPTGTYYYMIQPVTGEKKTGWVYINREIK